MNIKKKIMMLIMSVGMIFGVASCGNNNSGNDDNKNDIKIIKVRSLSAESVEEEQNDSSKMSLRRTDTNYTLRLSEESQDKLKAQYTVVNGYNPITFKIELDNPEGSAIDSIRLSCDSPGSYIYLDNQPVSMRIEGDNGVVANWAQENPYYKIFKIQFTGVVGEKEIKSIKVLDIRLAGHEKWQSKETEVKDFGLNELKVYKITDEDIKLNILSNEGLNNLTFKFDCYSEKVSNLKITFSNNEIKEIEPGVYNTTFGTDISYSFDIFGLPWTGKTSTNKYYFYTSQGDIDFSSLDFIANYQDTGYEFFIRLPFISNDWDPTYTKPSSITLKFDNGTTMNFHLDSYNLIRYESQHSYNDESFTDILSKILVEDCEFKHFYGDERHYFVLNHWVVLDEPYYYPLNYTLDGKYIRPHQVLFDGLTLTPTYNGFN